MVHAIEPIHLRPTLSARTRKTIEEVVSAFENETPVIQYAYVENLGDGRGYTAGRAGFTTATGDLLTVVRRYVIVSQDPGFIHLLPTLILRSFDESDSTIGLELLPSLWADAATHDPRFRKIQDQVNNELYFNPALFRADDLGFKTPLGILCIYDTFIQHGKAGAEEIIRQLNPALTTEKEKILDFLKIRYEALMHPANRSTADVWQESVGRVDALRMLVNHDLYDLPVPFTINPFETPIEIR
jgi:chitosanase